METTSSAAELLESIRNLEGRFGSHQRFLRSVRVCGRVEIENRQLRFSLTIQSIAFLPSAMVNDIKRVMSSYPQIYLACHRRHMRDDERGTVLTLQQASILDHLEAQGETTLSKLASHLGVTDSTASTGIARLAKGGYVVRRRDIADKRRVFLALTATGKRVVQQNSVLDPEDVDEMLRLLEPAQRDAAVSALEALARAAQELLRRREKQRRR